MPDDAAQSDSDAGGSGGLMYGSRGWIIVFLVVILEAAFFVVLLATKSDKEPADTDVNTSLGRYSADNFMEKKLDLNNLSYSIPMPSGQPMTLAMSLTLIMQPTPKEIREKVNITPEDWAKFDAVLKKLEPWIKDQLNQSINKMSSSELITDRGQQQIRELVKEKVNTKLDSLDLKLSSENVSKRRIQEVLITSFYFN